MKAFRFSAVAFAAVVLCSMASSASAAVIGHLDTGICSGGGVTVTGTTIDWTPPVAGGSGCIVTGSATSITYTGGGPLGSGVQGTILDLNSSMSFPIMDFMTFSGNPDLHFDLIGIGSTEAAGISTGVNNFNCGSLSIGQSCSVFEGSPFILTRTGTNATSVTLAVNGLARDLSPDSSPWNGAFTTQISTMAPGAIQTTILGGGSVTSTHSGDFNVSFVVPEPGTTVLLGSALVALGLARRRFVKR